MKAIEQIKLQSLKSNFSHWVVPRQKKLLNVKSHSLHQAWMMQLELLYVLF